MMRDSIKHLIIVLLLSVSTQALSVVFDSHAAHQDSEKHLSDTQFDNASQTALATGESSNSNANGLDCQHCCHCHGAQHIFLPLLIKPLPVDGNYPVRQSLTQPPADGYWRNVLRPPIA